MFKKVSLFVGLCIALSSLFTACKKDDAVSQSKTTAEEAKFVTVPFKLDKTTSRLKSDNVSVDLTRVKEGGKWINCVKISSYFGGTILWPLSEIGGMTTYDEAIKSYGTGDWRMPTKEEVNNIFMAIQLAGYDGPTDVADFLGMDTGGGLLNMETNAVLFEDFCHYWVVGGSSDEDRWTFAASDVNDGGVVLRQTYANLYKAKVHLIKRLE